SELLSGNDGRVAYLHFEFQAQRQGDPSLERVHESLDPEIVGSELRTQVVICAGASHQVKLSAESLGPLAPVRSGQAASGASPRNGNLFRDIFGKSQAGKDRAAVIRRWVRGGPL